MAAKSIKTKTKKANKIAKKAVKSISKKSTKNVKKAKKAIVAKSKYKVKNSSKPSSSKLRPKSKPKLKAMRTTTTKKKHVTTDNKSLKNHISNKVAKKSATKKKKIHKLPVNTSHSSSNFAISGRDVENNLVNPAVLNPELQSDVLFSGPAGKFEPYKMHSSEEYMNEQQLQHFTEILHDWKQDLMMEVDHTISEMKEADVLADLNDRATQEETFNLELRARDRERKLIKKIETALNKIKHHEYGYCDSCGVEIGVRRLEARPTATLCIECKTLAEIREKRV